MIETLRLSNWQFGRHGEYLLPPLDYSISSGQAVRISGENAIGKTSLLRSLCGLIRDVSGEVSPATSPSDYSYLNTTEIASGPEKVAEHLYYWRKLLGVPWRDGYFSKSDNHIFHAMERLQIDKLHNTKLRSLSSGQFKRLQLARIWLSSRQIWLLDEPLNSLDEPGKETLHELAAQHLFNAGIIIAVSHEPLSFAHDQLELNRDWG